MYVFPNPDPIALSIGPLHVRWYGLMYLLGFLAAWYLARRRAAQPGSTWKAIDVDDLIFFAAIGLIIGGRLGWVLFYGLEDMIREPSRALRIWEGGMSVPRRPAGRHGSYRLVCPQQGQTDRFDVFDFTAPLPALGLFAGRIGNFINGELWGKPTDVPWAFVVNGTPLHPSQLYEAFFEGIVLFADRLGVYPQAAPAGGAPSSLWILCYGVFRFAVEFVRVPDANRGYLLWDWVTEGQLLCMPMIVVGCIFWCAHIA